ncbi:MAG TPA: tRNA (adenosine(37)-N6)-threonylcarbamoyltransferase complex dimerization subunit type 1 TsaB, partial [Verrucomicrobiae bacterium]|nr:tRNA (adenosine(37)-N6)-threonylcarbamoyltransferase complex dimerization subunit type 1 TsaB [Verrucomicrobiae bacterium]
ATPVLFLGAGAEAYRDAIASRLEAPLFAPSYCSTINPAAGAFLTWRKLVAGETTTASLLGPAYIRPSEAELAAKRVDALLY